MLEFFPECLILQQFAVWKISIDFFSFLVWNFDCRNIRKKPRILFFRFFSTLKLLFLRFYKLHCYPFRTFSKILTCTRHCIWEFIFLKFFHPFTDCFKFLKFANFVDSTRWSKMCLSELTVFSCLIQFPIERFTQREKGSIGSFFSVLHQIPAFSKNKKKFTFFNSCRDPNWYFLPTWFRIFWVKLRFRFTSTFNVFFSQIIGSKSSFDI